MKKAFTLSEALITLGIIGILASILLPVMNNVRPDKDKITYKKALFNMQSAVSTAMESSVYTMAANSAAYWKDSNVGASDFCSAVADSLNTSGAINCTGTSSYENPNFVTTDGIRYWGLEGGFKSQDGEGNPTTLNEKTIYVDRKLSSSEASNIGDKRGRDGATDKGMKIQVRYDGKVSTPSGDDYDYENDLVENSFSITEGSN